MSMTIIDGLDSMPASKETLHMAIGMFDGLHLGHQSVIRAACQTAQRMGGQSCVFTFDPHPSRLFKPNEATDLIQPFGIKQGLMEKLGANFLIKQEFTHELAAIEAEDFLKFIKGKLPKLSSIYVGDNFRYGKGRRGDVQLLIDTGKDIGITVFSMPRVQYNGEAISSTRIRTLITNGQITDANELLGYTYFAQGTVAPGQQLARTLGYPTLNVQWIPECLPTFGVYAASVKKVGKEETQPAVANYGVKPTVATKQDPLLEAHILGDTELTRGDEIIIELHKYLRSEKKFGTLDGLKAAIARDCAHARDYFIL